MELCKEDSAPAAKRPRMEPQNDKEIIQDQRQVIENLKARIQQLEEERLKFLPVPELPNETWIKIMSYLSTYDVLINVAQVSKKFHQLSQDPHLIRKIHVDYESWPENQKEEYRKEFLRVLKRSVNITFLSFQFGFKGKLRSLAFLNRWCPKLKKIKIEFKPDTTVISHNNPMDNILEWESLRNVQKIITSFSRGFHHSNLQELEMIGFEIDMDTSSFKKFLQFFAENFPKLQRLFLSTELSEEYAKICQDFASAKNIKLEIRGLPEQFVDPQFVTMRPSQKVEIFAVQKKQRSTEEYVPRKFPFIRK